MTKKIIVVDDDSNKRGHIIAAAKAIAENNGLEVEVVPFTHVEPYLEYLATKPEDIIAVCADNAMYKQYRGIEMLIAASKALPNAGLFWSSSDKPSDKEHESLVNAGVNYTVATSLVGGKDAAELIEDGRNEDGTVPDYLKRHEGLFVFQDRLKAAKPSAFDMARREGDVRTPLAQAARPSDGTLGVDKK